jgi:hypothetical protein
MLLLSEMKGKKRYTAKYALHLDVLKLLTFAMQV